MADAYWVCTLTIDHYDLEWGSRDIPYKTSRRWAVRNRAGLVRSFKFFGLSRARRLAKKLNEMEAER